MPKIPQRFKAQFEEAGILKGAHDLKTQLSRNLTLDGKAQLTAFYNEHDTSYYHEVDAFIDAIENLDAKHMAYIWRAKRPGKGWTIYGHTIIDPKGEILTSGYCRDINSARVVNLCNKQITGANQ